MNKKQQLWNFILFSLTTYMPSLLFNVKSRKLKTSSDPGHCSGSPAVYYDVRTSVHTWSCSIYLKNTTYSYAVLQEGAK